MEKIKKTFVYRRCRTCGIRLNKRNESPDNKWKCIEHGKPPKHPIVLKLIQLRTRMLGF